MRRRFGSIALCLLVAACGGIHRADLSFDVPKAPPGVLSIRIERPADEVMAAVAKHFQGNFWTVSAFDGTTGSISATFRTDEAWIYIDCGSLTSKLIDDDGVPHVVTFPIAGKVVRKVQSWRDLVWGIGYIEEERVPMLVGEAQVNVVPDGKTAATISVNIKYDIRLTIKQRLTQPNNAPELRHLPTENWEQFQFDSRFKGRCVSMGRMENTILRAASQPR